MEIHGIRLYERPCSKSRHPRGFLVMDGKGSSGFLIPSMPGQDRQKTSDDICPVQVMDSYSNVEFRNCKRSSLFASISMSLESL